jgi:uncharacterized membrane protein
MIFATMTRQQKKRLSRLIVGFGLIALIIGFFPGWLPWQLGVVILIFCFVAVGIIYIIIDEPEPGEKHEIKNENAIEEVLKLQPVSKIEKTTNKKSDD